MSTIASQVIGFLKREDGPTAVEYAVVLALIIVVGVTAIGTLVPSQHNLQHDQREAEGRQRLDRP